MADRLSDKSPDAFRTISEVADHLDLPQHVLRFWETKFPEIRPVKRAGGRRFYRPEDVDLLRAIRHLLYTEGYTIKGVQKVLKDQGTRTIQAMGGDLLEGRPLEDLRQPAPKPAPAPKSPAPAAQAGEGGARGLLGGLLPRRRERSKPDADFVTDMEPLFPPVPQASDTTYGTVREERAWPRLDAGPARPPARDARADPDGGYERDDDAPAPRARPPRYAPPAQVAPEEPGLPFDDMEPEFEAPRAPPVDHGFPSRAQTPHLQASRDHAPREQAPRVPTPFVAMEDEEEDWFEPGVPSEAPPPVQARAPEVAAVRPAPLRRPTRGPASRIPDPVMQPELEDPLLPFFDEEMRESDDDVISEPLDARIRRLKEHTPREEEPVLRRRVGPLTAPLEDVGPAEFEEDGWGESVGAPAYAPPEPRRQGPPEQYLPPHLRSEPRMTAAPAHPPQPVLSRDDMHRLQATLYELGECRRLLTSAMEQG